MSKFVIECPKCGNYTEASTGGFLGIGKTRKINCVCGYEINVSAEKMRSKVCPHCGNNVIYDLSKGEDAVCPVCHEHINTRESLSNIVEFSCPSCSCRLSADKNAKPGDIITFGSYEQDNDLSNGKEPIEWVVLENNEDNVKVISRYILDAVPYHKFNEYTSWFDSTIHEWLNNDFYNAAFSEKEKYHIQPTGEVAPHGYIPIWSNVYLWDLYDMVSYYGGNIGYNENEEYYTSSQLRAEATPYAIANGSDNNSWWLEDTGKSQWGYSAVAVRWESAADTLVQSYFCGARPVISLIKG